MNLHQLLIEQEERLASLEDLLRREQDVLIQGAVDTDQMEALAQAKQAPLSALEQLENRRHQAQLALGYGEGREGAEQAARAAGCLDAWQSVQDAARRTVHLNRLNGSLIDSRLSHNQRVLETLRQMAGHATYGADGQPRKDRSRLQLQA